MAKHKEEDIAEEAFNLLNFEKMALLAIGY